MIAGDCTLPTGHSLKDPDRRSYILHDDKSIMLLQVADCREITTASREMHWHDYFRHRAMVFGLLKFLLQRRDTHQTGGRVDAYEVNVRAAKRHSWRRPQT